MYMCTYMYGGWLHGNSTSTTGYSLHKPQYYPQPGYRPVTCARITREDGDGYPAGLFRLLRTRTVGCDNGKGQSAQTLGVFGSSTKYHAPTSMVFTGSLRTTYVTCHVPCSIISHATSRTGCVRQLIVSFPSKLASFPSRIPRPPRRVRHVRKPSDSSA